MQLNYHITLKVRSGNIRRFFLQFNDEFDYLFWRRTTTNRGDKIIKTTKL